MSIGRAIVALEDLSVQDLEIVLHVGARLLARASEGTPEQAPRSTSTAAERARRYRQRHAESVTERDGRRDGERDASRSSVTESVTLRDGERDAVTGLARGPSGVLLSDPPSVLKARKPQSRSESESDAREGVTNERDASRVTESVTRDGESVTQQAESARKTIAAAYRSRGLAVPRQAASLASTAETAAALAGLPPDALPGILARFFEDRRMREKGYPISYLLTNPNQWATDGPQGRDEGEARERPAVTVLPDWLQPKPHPTEAA